jgi:hypothetical protein
MKRNKVLQLILLLLILIYFYWKLTQGFDTPKMEYWTQEKMDSWTTKIIKSSNYLITIDSTEAYEIGKCASEKLIDSFKIEDIKKIEVLSLDSQRIVFDFLIKDCLKSDLEQKK